MSSKDFDSLIVYAKLYRRNAQASIGRGIKETIKQDHIEAVLCDFINYIGMLENGDYTLDTSGLGKYGYITFNG